MSNPSNWYASWFNTPYYHILYKDRDYTEAALLIQNLVAHLQLSPDAKVLDLACGKGRHARLLNTMGFNVVGADLSENNITYAKQFENERLQFHVHNMLVPFPDTFDAVFNLFTSFGYFDSHKENQQTISAIKQALKNKGIGVIDFLNPTYVTRNLVPKEEKVIEGIRFIIHRTIAKNHVVKRINFKHNHTDFEFFERVQLLTLSDFEHYLKQANCQLINTFGDYHLNPYHDANSERLILTFR